MRAIKRQSIQEWTLNLNWSEKIVKTKNLFWNIFNVSDFSTPFLSRQLLRVYNMVLVIGVKLYRNDLKGNKNYFELVGGLFCRTFVIPVALCNKLDVDSRRTSNPIISIIIDNDNSNSPTIMIIIIMIRSIERFSAPIYQVGRASGAEETVHIASTAVFRLQDLQLFLCERYLETMR